LFFARLPKKIIFWLICREFYLKIIPPKMNTSNRIKLFIIDANKTFAQLMVLETGKIFKEENHTVHVFENGELCEQFLHIKPDLVFVDYHLNSNNSNAMNGLQVIKMIKNTNPEMDFIIITNDEKSELFLKVLQTGAYDYLIKDSNVTYRLGQAMTKWLKRAKLKQDIKPNNLLNYENR